MHQRRFIDRWSDASGGCFDRFKIYHALFLLAIFSPSRNKKPLAEPNPPGAFARVDDALGRRPAQAELAIIIAAAMLIPMLCKMAVIVRYLNKL